jgi:hypothetical protein
MTTRTEAKYPMPWGTFLSYGYPNAHDLVASHKAAVSVKDPARKKNKVDRPLKPANRKQSRIIPFFVTWRKTHEKLITNSTVSYLETARWCINIHVANNLGGDLRPLRL